ncbi:HU family DNA-binding protein [Thermodesulfobacteriota bacterium]
MNKSEIARIVAEKNDISLKSAQKAVDSIFEILMETLAEGQKIEIRGFGSLTIRNYEAYTGRNPRTGELTDVKEKKSPFFKTGKELKDRLNAENDEGGE